MDKALYLWLVGILTGYCLKTLRSNVALRYSFDWYLDIFISLLLIILCAIYFFIF